MPDVMDQRGDADRGPVFSRDRIFRGKAIEDAGREVVCTQAMCEPRMLRALVCKMRKAKLPDAAKPLKLGGIDELRDKGADVVAGIDTNDIVNRIAVNSLWHLIASLTKFIRS